MRSWVALAFVASLARAFRMPIRARVAMPRYSEVSRSDVVLGGVAVAMPLLLPRQQAVAAPELAISYMPYLRQCLSTLEELLANWEEITKREDGDEIRRYIGTVGSKSPLAKIRPALQAVQRADDLPEDLDVDAFLARTEAFFAALTDVENMSYSANFAGYSGGGQLNAAQFIGKSKKSVEEAREALAALIEMLSGLESG